jgi:hypothetical protein
MPNPAFEQDRRKAAVSQFRRCALPNCLRRIRSIMVFNVDPNVNHPDPGPVGRGFERATLFVPGEKDGLPGKCSSHLSITQGVIS